MPANHPLYLPRDRVSRRGVHPSMKPAGISFRILSNLSEIFPIQRIHRLAIILTAACTAHAQITVTKPIPQSTTVDVYAGQVDSHTIPRTIFGTFLEPIGNSTYNGLWAELLENPSFESGLWSPEKTADMMRERPELRRSSSVAIPLPWEPLDARQGNRYEVHYGDAANSW